MLRRTARLALHQSFITITDAKMYAHKQCINREAAALTALDCAVHVATPRTVFRVLPITTATVLAYWLRIAPRTLFLIPRK